MHIDAANKGRDEALKQLKKLQVKPNRSSAELQLRFEHARGKELVAHKCCDITESDANTSVRKLDPHFTGVAGEQGVPLCIYFYLYFALHRSNLKT